MNLKKIKALMFDIDETLIDRKLKMSNNVLEALKSLKNKGYNLAINTGRPTYGALSVMNRNNAEDIFNYYFCCNGAEIYNYQTKELTKCSTISKDVLRKLDPYFKSENMALAYYTDKDSTLVLNHDNLPQEVIEEWAYLRCAKPKILDFQKVEESPTKCVVLFRNIEFSQINKQLELANLKEIHIMRSGKDCGEITKNNVSKGTAVDMYSQILGINPKEILCFGDAQSDVPALINGVGCMVNGKDTYKQLGIEYYSLGVHEDGVYHFLKDHKLI